MFKVFNPPTDEQIEKADQAWQKGVALRDSIESRSRAASQLPEQWLRLAEQRRREAARILAPFLVAIAHRDADEEWPTEIKTALDEADRLVRVAEGYEGRARLKTHLEREAGKDRATVIAKAEQLMNEWHQLYREYQSGRREFMRQIQNHHRRDPTPEEFKAAGWDLMIHPR